MAGGADAAGQEHGIEADVGADVGDAHVGLDKLGDGLIDGRFVGGVEPVVVGGVAVNFQLHAFVWAAGDGDEHGTVGWDDAGEERGEGSKEAGVAVEESLEGLGRGAGELEEELAEHGYELTPARTLA